MGSVEEELMVCICYRIQAPRDAGRAPFLSTNRERGRLASASESAQTERGTLTGIHHRKLERRRARDHDRACTRLPPRQSEDKKRRNGRIYVLLRSRTAFQRVKDGCQIEAMTSSPGAIALLL